MNFFVLAGIFAVLLIIWTIYTFISGIKKAVKITTFLAEADFLAEDMYFDRQSRAIAFDHQKKLMSLINKKMQFIIFPQEWLSSHTYETKPIKFSKKIKHVLTIHVEQPEVEQVSEGIPQSLLEDLSLLEFDDFPNDLMEHLQKLKK